MNTPYTTQRPGIQLSPRIVGSLSLIAIGAGAMALPQANATETARSFVEASIEKGTSILQDRSLNDVQRQAQFHDFLASITDMKRVGGLRRVEISRQLW